MDDSNIFAATSLIKISYREIVTNGRVLECGRSNAKPKQISVRNRPTTCLQIHLL